MPDDFQVILNHDGGMSPLSAEYGIGLDSSWVMYNNMGTKRRYRVSLPKDTVSKIYQSLQDNNFERITVREEDEVYDRGGHTISVRVNGEWIEKSNSQNSFVESKWGKSFLFIKEDIIQTIDTALTDRKTEITILVDSSVYELGLLKFYTERGEINFDALHDTANTTVKNYLLLPGTYDFSASVFQKEGDSWNLNRITDLHEEIVIDKEKKLRLYLSEGKLRLDSDE